MREAYDEDSSAPFSHAGGVPEPKADWTTGGPPGSDDLQSFGVGTPAPRQTVRTAGMPKDGLHPHDEQRRQRQPKRQRSPREEENETRQHHDHRKTESRQQKRIVAAQPPGALLKLAYVPRSRPQDSGEDVQARDTAAAGHRAVHTPGAHGGGHEQIELNDREEKVGECERPGESGPTRVGDDHRRRSEEVVRDGDGVVGGDGPHTVATQGSPRRSDAG